jgi:hypothetical protein
MSIFVSYSRADNTLERLSQLRGRLAKYSDVYVDDLDWMESGVGRLESVCARLLGASVFVAVVSKNYGKTPWTAWELNCAKLCKIPIFAYLPDGYLIDKSQDEWLLNPLCAEFVPN